KDPDDLVREAGREAFDSLIAQARPLSDLLWMRETSGRVFDTPERRAELEKRVQILAASIRDENLRRYYLQELRERVTSFFGTRNTGRRGWQENKRTGKRASGAGRRAVSESLARSALVRAASRAMPLREAAILVAVVNHPSLID